VATTELTYKRKKKSMNEEIKKKLVALEANVDAVLFRRMYEDEEQQSGMGVGRALNIGVGAAALGAGAYGAKIGDQAIRRKYGMMPGVGRREAYRRAGIDAFDFLDKNGMADASRQAERLKATGRQGMAAGQKAWSRAGAQGAGLFSRLRRVLGGATRAMTGGRFGFEAIEGRVNRLIELADRDEKSSYVGGAAGGAAKGAAAAGVLGALGAGGLAALAIKGGAFRDPIVQRALRSIRRAGVDKDGLRRAAAPGMIGGAAGVYGAKAAKYGALVGGGIGIGSARRKQEQG
jgi:hypothetical protein